MGEPRSFYHTVGLHVAIYDALTALGGQGVADDIPFYTRCAQRFGAPVLELGAGTGRVSWALAEAGFAAVGLDLSEAMLAQTEAKRAGMPPAAQRLARFVRGDMTDFDLGHAFPLTIIPYRAFQSLTSPEQQRRSLECIHRHLANGGHLVIDLFDPWLDRCVPGTSPDPTVHRVRHPDTGNEVQVQIVQHTNDPLQQVLTEVWRFREVGADGAVVRQEEEVLSLRWTYRHEMRYLFELTGFAVEAEYSDFHEAPPAYGHEQVWVARKA